MRSSHERDAHPNRDARKKYLQCTTRSTTRSIDSVDVHVRVMTSDQCSIANRDSSIKARLITVTISEDASTPLLQENEGDPEKDDTKCEVNHKDCASTSLTACVADVWHAKADSATQEDYVRAFGSRADVSDEDRKHDACLARERQL